MFNISPNGFLADLALRRSEPDRDTGHPSAQITIFNINIIHEHFFLLRDPDYRILEITKCELRSTAWMLRLVHLSARTVRKAVKPKAEHQIRNL